MFLSHFVKKSLVLMNQYKVCALILFSLKLALLLNIDHLGFLKLEHILISFNYSKVAYLVGLEDFPTVNGLLPNDLALPLCTGSKSMYLSYFTKTSLSLIIAIPINRCS
jgi:hypothetical protein